ncbi:hypothetical protein SAY87_021308 [Trapa incisa]|uniref:Methyltransferase type 11 domain-containing protein n=1 Tax=Trapa incisa TaxID=236973 RepID=A0AAN7PVS4_9MYRT|nr:hypothetical protein SAY87_021308 [Trapa incisa]
MQLLLFHLWIALRSAIKSANSSVLFYPDRAQLEESSVFSIIRGTSSSISYNSKHGKRYRYRVFGITREMGRTSSGRDWSQIYAIYGLEHRRTLLLLILQAIVFSVLSVIFLVYFGQICVYMERVVPSSTWARFAAGFVGSLTAVSAVCMYFAAASFFYSALPLHADMAKRIVSTVSDWSGVRKALDLGCGRGILLNAVAAQLKNTGSSGQVVGLAQCKRAALATLRTANMEGVQDYVTCREGDARRLPFPDDYFDVVVSAAFVHTIGREHGRRSAMAAAERMRVLGELARVLKPGGVGVMWDLIHVAEYVQRLEELRMDEIRVSNIMTAFMVQSHIVSFRKPNHHVAVGPNEVKLRLDWRS